MNVLLLCREDGFVLRNADARAFVPWKKFAKLKDATHAQRANWRWVGGRHGIHWPDVDEDLKVENLMRDFKTELEGHHVKVTE